MNEVRNGVIMTTINKRDLVYTIELIQNIFDKGQEMYGYTISVKEFCRISCKVRVRMKIEVK